MRKQMWVDQLEDNIVALKLKVQEQEKQIKTAKMQKRDLKQTIKQNKKFEYILEVYQSLREKKIQYRDAVNNNSKLK